VSGPPRVLSIAGTDPTGGAGIQADLKSIAATGGYGMAVVTALVAQNTCGVREVHAPAAPFLRAQLDAVSDDVVVDAVKLGMLFDVDLIRCVASWLRTHRPRIVVLDPVMVATSGDRLLRTDAVDAVRDLLAALGADGDVDVLATPNVPELAVLAEDRPAVTIEAVRAQAVRVAAAYGVRVLAKGGHLDAVSADDLLVGPDGTVVTLTSPRVATRHSHGTGCSLSSALATLRVRHGDWEVAAREAKRWLTESLEHADSLEVGRGRGPVSHFAGLWGRAGLSGRPTAPTRSSGHPSPP